MSDSGGCCACDLSHASATDYVGETLMWNLGRAVPVAAGRSGSPMCPSTFSSQAEGAQGPRVVYNAAEGVQE